MNRAAAPPWSSVHHSLSSRASLAGSSWWIAIAVVVLVAIAPTGLSHRTNDDGQEEAEWMAEVPGGLVMARQIAAHHGLHLREQVQVGSAIVFYLLLTTRHSFTITPSSRLSLFLCQSKNQSFHSLWSVKLCRMLGRFRMFLSFVTAHPT